MTLYITKHPLSTYRTGAPSSMMDGPPTGGQRLASGLSGSFSGPAEYRLHADADTFVAIGTDSASLDTTAATAIRIPAGGVEWIRLDAGPFYFKAG